MDDAFLKNDLNIDPISSKNGKLQKKTKQIKHIKKERKKAKKKNVETR